MSHIYTKDCSGLNHQILIINSTLIPVTSQPRCFIKADANTHRQLLIAGTLHTKISDN